MTSNLHLSLLLHGHLNWLLLKLDQLLLRLLHLVNFGVLKNRELVLQCLVAFDVRCIDHAHAHIQLQHREDGDSDPQGERDGVVLVRDVDEAVLA